jgi:uncharacterized protein (TIGR03437 family)
MVVIPYVKHMDEPCAPANVYSGNGPSFPTVPLSIEYAGAAPELLSGVTQLNVTLPEVIPATQFYPPGVLALFVLTNGQLFGYQTVTIFVAQF